MHTLQKLLNYVQLVNSRVQVGILQNRTLKNSYCVETNSSWYKTKQNKPSPATTGKTFIWVPCAGFSHPF